MRKRTAGFIAAVLVGTSAAAFAGLASIPVGNVLRPLIQGTLSFCDPQSEKTPPSLCGPRVGPLVRETLPTLLP